MENNLILETSRIKEIMGVNTSNNLLSEQLWLRNLITKIGPESKIINDFFSSGGFKNFDELRGFLNSCKG